MNGGKTINLWTKNFLTKICKIAMEKEFKHFFNLEILDNYLMEEKHKLIICVQYLPRKKIYEAQLASLGE